MVEFLLFIIIVAIVYWQFIRRGKSMANDMGKLALRGIDIDAQVTKKYQVNNHHAMGKNNYMIYSFTLGSQRSFSRQISPSSEQWATLEVGDTLAVVYLDEDPNISTTKEMIDQVRAAMPKNT